MNKNPRDQHFLGVRPSTLHLPAGPWATVLDCLCTHFPAISRAQWQLRMQEGRVFDAQGRPFTPHDLYREGLCVHYVRTLAAESHIPFIEKILYQDAHLVVVDKPHFLPVIPSGHYAEQTLLARLVRRLNNPALVPLHRIDRLTAGLVLFSAHPATRGQYQALFRTQAMHKVYEAIAPSLPDLSFPLVHQSRLVASTPFFRMQEVAGPVNSETRIECLEQQGAWCRYRLYPRTGKKHQLRVHLAGLGAGICYDPFYPELTITQDTPDDYQKPLQLLAKELSFVDPRTKQNCYFMSQQHLDWPQC